MSVLGFPPGAIWSDPRTGQLSPDAQRFIQQIILSQNGEGAGATIDGTQTLTNKTISGDLNTLSNIGTNSLKNRTGSDNRVVTGTAGASGTVAQWNANGDLTSGPVANGLLSSDVAEEAYLSRDGTLEATGPVRLATFTVATVPDATVFTQGLIYVSDEAGGATVAFSDGTNWRRVQDRAVIS